MATRRKATDERTQAGKTKDTSVTVALIGAGATILAALIGLVSLRANGSGPTTVPSIAAPVTEGADRELIFKESFDNNHADWSTGSSDHSAYSAEKFIKDGKYYRSMQTKDIAEATYGSVPIPTVNDVEDFCLIFDARLSDTVENSSIIVNARSTNFGTGKGGYYTLHLYSDGDGLVAVNGVESATKKISIFENGFHWNDKQVHTVKLSFQKDVLEIYDGQSNALLYRTVFTGDQLLLGKGDVRLGLEVLASNQKTTAEFDNIFVYDTCQ